MVQQQSTKFQVPSTIGSYEVGEQIGVGTFSVVHKGIHTETGTPVALKFATKTNSVIREIKILRRLQHKSIVHLFTAMVTDQYYCLVFEWIDGTDLLSVLENGKLPEEEAMEIVRQILDTLHYCHTNNIIHRDIKPENVLIDSKRKIKLIDFGLATLSDDIPRVRRACGSVLYAAPEVHAERPYVGPEVDMWSLGVLLYCMVTGLLPWSRQNLVENILNGKYFPVENEVSPSCAHLISRLLEVDQAKRATAANVFEHPWLNGRSFNFVPTAGHSVTENTNGN